MAYVPYPYGGYPQYYPQPVPDQLTQLRQNQIQPQQMALQPPQQNSGMIWVAGKTEADSYPIAPGCAVALWDSSAPVVYLRQADATGKPSTKVFDLVERIDAPTVQAAPQVDLSRFVTIDQLDEILAERLKKPARATTKREDIDNG